MKHYEPSRKPEKQSYLLKNQNKEHFRELIKNSYNMIVLIGSDGVQHYVSESCEQILGFRPEELMNIPVIEEMIHPEDRQKTLLDLQAIIANKGVGGTQYRHRHKNGGWVYLEAFGTNQLDNPYVQAVILNIRNITERKLIEKTLQEKELHLKQLNAGKDKFFSIIAHDLKSPFNSILGFSEILIEQVQERNLEEMESYAMGIRYSAKRTLDLLNNLLVWSQSHTGRMKYNPVNINLVDLLRETIHIVENSARQKSIAVKYDLPDELIVFADKEMLATVIRNLLSNGIKFTRPGGGVKIGASVRGNFVQVNFKDNGVGLSAENINKLFKIEDSYSTPGTCKEQGTGLGLLLCKEFIEKHGCEIGVESKEGKGSNFWFTLPVASHSRLQSVNIDSRNPLPESRS